MSQLSRIYNSLYLFFSGTKKGASIRLMQKRGYHTKDCKSQYIGGKSALHNCDNIVFLVSADFQTAFVLLPGDLQNDYLSRENCNFCSQAS